MSEYQDTDVNNCIKYGKYQEALKILNSIQKENPLSDDDLLKKKYVQIFICLDKGEFQKGIKLADEMIQESQERKNKLRECDAYIGKIENYMCLGFINEGLEIIETGERVLSEIRENLIKEIKLRQAYFIFLKGRISQDKYEIFPSIRYFRQSYEIRKEINDQFGMLWSLLNWGVSIIAMGDFKKGEKYLNESLNIALDFNITVALLWSLIHLGWIKYHFMDLKSGISLAKKGLSICEQRNIKYVTTFYHDLLGHIHLVKGNLNEALFFFNKSQNIRLENDYNHILHYSYHSIGEVHRRKGELRQSLNYYKKCLDNSFIELRSIFKPKYLSIIGKIYGELGDFPTAKKYLLKSLNLQSKRGIFVYHSLNLNVSIAKTYHYLINLSIENDDIEEISKYLDELYQISIKYSNFKELDQLYHLNKAIVYKSSNRLRDKIKAGIIFKNIAEEKIINHEINIEAMTNLCEILLYEFELTGNQEILIKIENLLNKLLNIAHNQYLYDLLAEIYFFKAKISLLHLDIKNARSLLTLAQEIANKYDLKILAKKISYEHDYLLKNIDEWEEKSKMDLTLKERFSKIRYEFLFSKMVKSKIDILPNEHDSPIYLVILNIIDGHCLYDKIFREINIVDGNLIAGFISAINLFGKEAFSSSESIDRIKHGDFMITLQSKDNFLFGYVFKGFSYSAITKLENFVKKLFKINILVEELSYSIQIHIEISEKTKLEIDKLVLKFFHEKIDNV